MGSEVREIFKIYYQSRLVSNDSVWCESSNLEEVKTMSKGYEVRYYEKKIYRVEAPWRRIKDLTEGSIDGQR